MVLPKVQQAQYGDSVKLEQLGAGRLTKNPAASVQDWKTMSGGRPAETDPVKAATRQSSRPQTGVQTGEDGRYQQLFDSLAVQHGAVLKWLRLASSPVAGPLTKAYALAAVKAYRRNLGAVRSQTPFFQ